MSIHNTVVAERRATTADLGFIPSAQLQADIARFRAMRIAWDDIADAALDFDTIRYDRARARFKATLTCQQPAIGAVVSSHSQEGLAQRPACGCLLAKEDLR